MDILVLFLILEGMLAAFHHWYDLVAGLSYMAFIMLRYVPSMPTFCRVFIINGCQILSKAFSASIEMIIWFLFFNLLMWCIILIDLQMLKNPCIPGMNPTWSWYMSFLVYHWIQIANILLRIFASIHQWYWPVIFFFVVSLALVSGWWWPHKMNWDVSSLCEFLEKVSEV